MSLSTEIQRAFFKATQDNPSLRIEPTLGIEMDLLHKIVFPVQEIIENSPEYDGRELKVSDLTDELRRMCIEAQATQSIERLDAREERTQLVNILQTFTESAREAEESGANVAYVGYEHARTLTEQWGMAQPIRDTATLYAQFMHRYEVAHALEQVASNIETAQAKHWQLNASALTAA